MATGQRYWSDHQQQASRETRLWDLARNLGATALLSERADVPSGAPRSPEAHHEILQTTTRAVIDLGVDPQIAMTLVRVLFLALSALEAERLKGVAKDEERLVRNAAAERAREQIAASEFEANDLLARRLGREARRKRMSLSAALDHLHAHYKHLVCQHEAAFRLAWETEDLQLDEEARKKRLEDR